MLYSLYFVKSQLFNPQTCSRVGGSLNPNQSIWPQSVIAFGLSTPIGLVMMKLKPSLLCWGIQSLSLLQRNKVTSYTVLSQKILSTLILLTWYLQVRGLHPFLYTIMKWYHIIAYNRHQHHGVGCWG